MNEYKRVRISDLVPGGRLSPERVEIIGVAIGSYLGFQENMNGFLVNRNQFNYGRDEEISFNFTLQCLDRRSNISVVSRERTSSVLDVTELEQKIARAEHNKKPVRVRGEYDSSRNRLIADSAEIITAMDGALSLCDVTEQSGQLSLASDGGELSITKE